MQSGISNKYKWGMSMNANEEMLAGYADPDADPDAT